MDLAQFNPDLSEYGNLRNRLRDKKLAIALLEQLEKEKKQKSRFNIDPPKDQSPWRNARVLVLLPLQYIHKIKKLLKNKRMRQMRGRSKSSIEAFWRKKFSSLSVSKKWRKKSLRNKLNFYINP